MHIHIDEDLKRLLGPVPRWAAIFAGGVMALLTVLYAAWQIAGMVYERDQAFGWIVFIGLVAFIFAAIVIGFRQLADL